MATYQANLDTPSASGEQLIDELIPDTRTINHIEVIENVINTLAQKDSAMVSHPPEGGYLWKFNYGSVEVFVQLTGTTDEDTLTVWSAVLHLPAKDEPKLTRQLLEMNATSTFEARFGIIEDRVVVLATRALAEISPGEVSRLVTVVATIADDNDEDLQFTFGIT
ncbi:MAG: YbjN domain-containing protein [Calothrix sp. MO_167.B12]|nr:YbjN domain-containing protein [Calothrix sp. MO_167.B12]